MNSVYNEHDVYKSGLSKSDLDNLMKYEDITDQIEFYSGVIVKNKKVLFNPYLKQIKINVSCYKSSVMGSDEYFFKLPTGYSYIGEFCSPFCQALNSDGASNSNISQYLIGIDGGRIAFLGRTITGTNYGIAIRVVLDFRRAV